MYIINLSLDAIRNSIPLRIGKWHELLIIFEMARGHVSGFVNYFEGAHAKAQRHPIAIDGPICPKIDYRRSVFPISNWDIRKISIGHLLELVS